MLNEQATHQAAQEGMNRVDQSTPETWKSSLLLGIQTIAAVRDQFTTDDLWEIMGDDFMNRVNPSAIGPVLARAAKNGVITRTGLRKDSIRPATHGRPLRVWTRG